jgi:hypothetical protein
LLPPRTTVDPERPPLPRHLIFAWDYEQAVKKYVAVTRTTRRKATADDYRKTLLCPDLRPLCRRQAHTIKVDEIQVIIDRVAETRYPQACAIFRKVRPFWNWMARPSNRKDSGVRRGTLDDLETRQRPRGQKATVRYFPPIAEVGLVLATARSGALEPALVAASQLVIGAVQRNQAVVSARRCEFANWQDEPGWGVWRVPAPHRKGVRSKDEALDIPRAIPLPPALWAAIQDQVARAGDSEWLFPAFRQRRKGMNVDHVSESTLTHLWDALPGVKASPHATRRALRTHGRQILKIEPLKLSLILDHGEGRQHIVTERHYADDEMLDVKMPIVSAWWELVEEHAAAAAPAVSDVDALALAISKARKAKKTKMAAEAA